MNGRSFKPMKIELKPKSRKKGKTTRRLASSAVDRLTGTNGKNCKEKSGSTKSQESKRSDFSNL